MQPRLSNRHSPGELASAAKFRADESEQPIIVYVHEDDAVANESKFLALGSVQPMVVTEHVPSSLLAFSAKLEDKESVHPRRSNVHCPRTVASESKLNVPCAMVHPCFWYSHAPESCVNAGK